MAENECPLPQKRQRKPSRKLHHDCDVENCFGFEPDVVMHPCSRKSCNGKAHHACANLITEDAIFCSRKCEQSVASSAANARRSRAPATENDAANARRSRAPANDDVLGSDFDRFSDSGDSSSEEEAEPTEPTEERLATTVSEHLRTLVTPASLKKLIFSEVPGDLQDPSDFFLETHARDFLLMRKRR